MEEKNANKEIDFIDLEYAKHETEKIQKREEMYRQDMMKQADVLNENLKRETNLTQKLYEEAQKQKAIINEYKKKVADCEIQIDHLNNLNKRLENNNSWLQLKLDQGMEPVVGFDDTRNLIQKEEEKKKVAQNRLDDAINKIAELLPQIK